MDAKVICMIGDLDRAALIRLIEDAGGDITQRLRALVQSAYIDNEISPDLIIAAWEER